MKHLITSIDGSALGLKKEQEMLPLLLTLALVVAQHLKPGFGGGCVLTLSLQFNEMRLAFGQLTLSFNYLTFDFPQLI
ncbi:hypothetical protein ACE103_05710 [Bradyrhizobium sp. ma5]|uniref:hypothetical protein n=1 Tax=Bradyrhizobium sp. ma5 TaxID=3344828 RepID=UPI0035D435F8